MTSRWRLALALVAAAVPAQLGRAAGHEPLDQPTVVVEVSDGGFHWLDAGLGALAALAAALLVIGLTLSVRRMNGRRRET